MIAYEFLTELQEFLVVDTETTFVDGKFHIIQLAIIPVVDGEVVEDPSKQYTTFLNPGVPIDENSQRIHHITDEQVKNAPKFSQIAFLVEGWFARENAVFVAHNAAFDLARLREEFERIGRPMFDVPLLDTMHLPSQLDYPLPTGGRNLDTVAKAFGYTRPKRETHDAVSDALLAARTLTGLLRYAASEKAIVEWDALHYRAGSFTTNTVAPPSEFDQPGRSPHPVVSEAHLATHKTLPKELSTKQAEKWVAEVLECTELGCELLRAKCDVAVPHAVALFHMLGLERPHIPHGWQLNTFLSGYLTVIQNAVTPAAAPGWWARHQFFQDLPVCDRTNPNAILCPDCREGNACPPDSAHQYLAIAAANAVEQPIPQARVLDLTRLDRVSQLETWVNNDLAELAGYVAYLLITQLEADGSRSSVSKAKTLARSLELEKVEPRLAMLVALDLYSAGNLLELDFLVNDLARRANTDPTFATIANWYLSVSHPRQTRPAPTRLEPWNSRPRNRVTTTRFKA